MQKFQALVIDDASIIRNFIRVGLGVVLPQIEILEASNGRFAQNILISKPIDLILCDWEMPEIDGQELLLWIRNDESLRDTPFIMVTSRDERKHVIAALRAGIDGYVIKPFSIEILERQIREVLTKRGVTL
ncbi:putative Chemotaxis protein CheY [Gammaproteobacteria bacterium]